MKLKISRKVIQIIGSIIGFVLLGYQIWKGFSSININIINNFNIWMICLSLLFAFLALIFQILGWLIINRSIGYYLPFSKIIFGYTFTFLPRYIPGSIWGYLTRSEWLLREFKMPYQHSLFISFLEMGGIFLVNLLLGTYFLNSSTRKTLVILILLLTLLLLITFKYLLPNFSTTEKYTVLFLKMNFLSWLIVVNLFIISWIFYGIGLMFTLETFGVNLLFNLSTILLITSINSISWLIGFVIFFVPAGIGIRELILNSLLVNTFLIPEGISSSIAVSNRIISLFAEVSLLLISFLIFRKSEEKLITTNYKK